MAFFVPIYVIGIDNEREEKNTSLLCNVLYIVSYFLSLLLINNNILSIVK